VRRGSLEVDIVDMDAGKVVEVTLAGSADEKMDTEDEMKGVSPSPDDKLGGEDEDEDEDEEDEEEEDGEGEEGYEEEEGDGDGSLLDTLAKLAAAASPVKQQQLAGRIQFFNSAGGAGDGGMGGMGMHGIPRSPRSPRTPGGTSLTMEDAAIGLKRLSSSEEMANYLEAMRRPRAMSEPWIKSSGSGGLGSDGGLASWFNPDGEDGHSMQHDDVEGGLDSMMTNYQHIYNRGGRIGIYTREERDDIIGRFKEKRKRRVWKKKIRYHCRKNLADRRVRIKGRFVKAEDMERMGLLPGGANYHKVLEAQGLSGAPAPASSGTNKRSRSGSRGGKKAPAKTTAAAAASSSSASSSSAISQKKVSNTPPRALAAASRRPFDPVLAAQAFAPEGGGGGCPVPMSPGGAEEGAGAADGGHEGQDEVNPMAGIGTRKRMRRHSIAY